MAFRGMLTRPVRATEHEALIQGPICWPFAKPFSVSVRQELVDDFDAIRKVFDDSFYCVNKRTLAEVNDARNRVRKFKELRDQLLQAHPMTSRVATAPGRTE